MSGKSHPLPGSDEARHNEIPEHIALEKGRGADARKGIQPNPEAVNPDGEPYRYDDLGRGPGSSRQGEQDGERPER